MQWAFYGHPFRIKEHLLLPFGGVGVRIVPFGAIDDINFACCTAGTR